MKKLMPMLAATGLVVFALLLVGGVVYGASRLVSGNKKDDVCRTDTHKAYTMTIKNNAFNPAHITAAYCDTLTVTNSDPTDRIIAFGRHDDHQPYDGVTEKLLSEGQTFKITFNQTGTFTIHDHLHDEVEGSFTVNP